MAQPQLVQIKLSRFDAQPWGFRLQGGVDFASPLLVQKVNGGSLAENAGLLPGDAVIKINDVDVYNMRHKDAQDIVVRSGNNFVITVQRGGSTWRPHVTPTGAVPQPNQNSPYLQTVTKTSLAHKQQDSQHIGCGYNNAARPFTNGSGDGNVKSIVNKQYNTPVGIYSDESIAETLSAQAEVLAGGVLGVNFKKNEKEYQADKSEVLKFLREEETGHTTPAFGHSQHYQDPSQEQHYQQQPQQQQQQHQQQVYHHPVHQQQQHHHQQHQQQQQQSATRHVNAPINTPKPPSTGGLPTGQNICTECERLITGVFVRIKDKNLHVECFKCATCGTSLKNQGYYNFNNKLYCEIHAKLAAQQSPPAGTEGYVPVPIKPNTKLSANTISSALSSHGYNGVSNGNAVSSHAPVNQGYARPFGAPASAPKSPVSFPPQPQQQWGASQPAAARPATGNSYATLPRSSIGQSQDPADNLQPQYEEECYESPTAGSAFFRTDPEVEEANRKKSLNFIWPPPNDDTHDTPTAAPLYIPPPETQHIIVKPPAKEQNAPQGQWQSHSAPALSSTMQTEMESGSDSYTSTSTTTTTTTEEYQRMYAAQVKAYQMQQMCEQSGSEFDYYTEDMEDNMRERRSAQICADSLNTPINTYRLVDMVREVTPSPVPQPSQSQKRVIFLDEPEVQEVADSNMYQIEQSSSNDQLEEEDQLILEDRTQILESQRIFQPTPEIKFEIAPVRHIPPTKIPNPVPKEWINPMVSALTTAPEVPFHMQDCPCPKPCDCKSEFEVIAPQKSTIQQEAKPPEAPPQILQESPPTGTRFTKAMTTASEFTMQFAPPVDQEVPLPEPSQPYMPPPTEIKPYLREDYRPKSPFLSALTTAPEKPFEAQFERDVPIHLLDLPTPKAHLSLSDALCVASDREYTPLNPENATHRIEEEQKRKEQKKYEFQVLDHEQELGIEPACTPVEYYTTENSSRRTSHRQSATFAAMQAFQTPNQTVTTNTPRNSVTSLCKEADTDLEYEKYCKAKERNQKRLSFLQKKEVELSQLQNQTPTQNQNQSSQTDNTNPKPLVSTNRKESSSSFNASSTVEVNNSNKNNNNNNNSYAYESQQLATIVTNKFDAHDIIEETAEELEHSEVLFPPPSPLSHLKGKHTSGLHRPETIPKYQRNWTVLPTQSPIRTPEPQELRENIPLAFVDAPKSNNAKVSSDNHVHKPIAQHQQQQQQQPQLAQPQQPRKSLTINSATSAPSASNAVAMTQRGSVEQTSSRLSSTPTVPIIIEERCGPISMAFQSLDELVPKDESQTPSRCFTPCSFTNKPAPIVPFYQTAEKLCFDECPAQHARDYDRRSASPFPDRARSPAPGPPPNPLAAIRAPRVKENELSPRMLQAGSITTGQSYLGAQQQHYESTTQAGYQSFLQKPETVQTSQVGDTRVEQRQSESQLAEQQKSQTQSKTTTQIGNTQIERRRRVTEEFEHSQTAKTIEIRTETDRRQSYGKTGFVANVARRLSGMEQEINSLSSQSQSISERAAHLSSGTVFPQLKSPEPPEKFPTKPVLPPHDEPQPQSYILSATANNNNKMIGPPPGFQQQQQRNSLSACYGTSLATAIRQQQQQQQQQQKSLSAYESTTSSIQSSLSNAVSSSLTMASASTTNQASVSSGVCPVTGTFCRPGHTCCKQQVMQTARADARSMSVSSAISNQYRPTASTGAVGFKPPQPQPQPQQQPQSQAFAAAPPQAPNVVARASIDIDPTNDVGSAGGAGGKGGAFGATSAPKRGRGIMNKAVAPGVRVPLCNSCQTQIRGPFITALGRIWCPEHFICVNANCRRPLQDIGFVEEKGDLYCEYCFEKYLAPSCSKCNSKIKGDCLNAIGRHFHPECFTCAHCGKIFGNTPFFLEDGNPYCEADWNELFTTKCFACGFPVEAGDRWVEALNHNYHSQCFNCTYCKQNLEGQSFYNKGGRPFCKNHAR